jgi:general nucleoside transport system permease protein
MSTDIAVRPPAASPPGDAARTPATRRRWVRYVLLAVAVFVVLSAVRALTGERDLTSAGTVSAALALAVPIGLAGLGGLWSERSGVINIGLEGMMVFGTWFGAWGALTFGGSPWAGLLVGIAGGALGGLLHAVATVTFGVDQIISGVAITILAPGVTKYLSGIYFDTPEYQAKGGGPTQSPPLPAFPDLLEALKGIEAKGWFIASDLAGLLGGGLAGLMSSLKRIEGEGWFLASDLAGLLGGLTTGLSSLTIIAVVLVVVSFFILWRTSFGLRLRSVGESPQAAESLGVPVYTMKYIAITISGALAGFGGVFLAMVTSSAYQENATNGRGYIGLAAMIFGNWRPGGLAMGAGLFGYTDALQLRGSVTAVHALLLPLALLLLAMALWFLTPGWPAIPRGEAAGRPLWVSRQPRLLAGLSSLVVAVGLMVWYLTTDDMPQQFTSFAPHLTTLLVLSLASQRLRAPATVGRPFRKGEG